ncbi:hypothetical protein [Clostridium sp. E02]|uniref:hypothetical protein n=1 Tax=Clostridium sp. E02 TaxID=2487134 RepID=UPI001FA9A1FB|nr:hypothetical protein [Clostridium sp. E02]
MQIIKVKFLKGEIPSGKAYTYFSDEEVSIGDLVQINSSAKGVVTEIDVPESEIKAFTLKVKTIVGKVTEKEPVAELQEATECLERYKIIGIYHKDGTPRNDGRYPLRVGRICEEPKAHFGLPMTINYIAKADGTDYRGFSLRTSPVTDIGKRENRIQIETMNSVYEFEKVEEI